MEMKQYRTCLPRHNTKTNKMEIDRKTKPIKYRKCLPRNKTKTK
jgi:hypothetical protein